MMLANPIFLWSLLGLSIPIGIHLLSRKEGKIIRIGSLRHIQETSTQQFKGIRLNEILLLALRCAMVILFSLLLSGLYYANTGNKKWVIVERDLAGIPSIKIILDSLRKDGYVQHQLSDGFPVTDDSTSEINYWKLAEQLNTMNLSSGVVFASNRLNDFKGMRIGLASTIRWISVSLPQVDFPLQVVRLDNDSLALRMGHSNANETYFNSVKTKTSPQGVQVSLPDSIRILVVSDDAYAYDKRILMTALNAIKKSFPIKMVIAESGPSGFSVSAVDWCFWLSDNQFSKSNSLKTVFMRVHNSNDLFTQTKPNEWELTRHLNEEIALEKNLTLRLAELLISSKQLHEISEEKDRRMMPDSMAWSQADSGKTHTSNSSTSADQFLVALLVVLLLIERILAFKRNQ
jgi:hypothetical protein